MSEYDLIECAHRIDALDARIAEAHLFDTERAEITAAAERVREDFEALMRAVRR